jgi:transcriptional regulator with XRE-family HTH domain
MNLGKSLKVALARKGLNQSELARKNDWCLRTINKLANRAGGTVENINQLSAALGMKASEFVALGED